MAEVLCTRYYSRRAEVTHLSGDGYGIRTVQELLRRKEALMDPEIVATVRKRMLKKPTGELISIYKARPGRYSEEAFEAIRQVLVERGVQDVSIDLRPREGNEQLAQEIEERLTREAPDSWGRTRTRVALLFLHIGILAVAIALTPADYAFELGYYTGYILLFSTLFLWVLLYSARTQKPILAFCGLALAQAGFMAFVGLRFRAQDATLRRVIGEVAQRRKEWETQMEQFRMDALFELLSDKRPLRREELVQLQARARAGKAKAQELQSETTRWAEQTESRLAAVSRGMARDFRRGVESSRTESDKTMKLVQDYFTETEQLAGFLIDRQHRYRVTTEGRVFNKDEDARAYKGKIDAIAHLQEQLDLARRKAEETSPQVPAPR